MGNICFGRDYGRWAEHLAAFALSPYALIIPIQGLVDKIESDFWCIGLEKKGRNVIPNINLQFLVQVKSCNTNNYVEIKNDGPIASILSNKMPLFFAMTNTEKIPLVTLYSASERIPFRYIHPNFVPKKLIFYPSFPTDHHNLYPTEEKDVCDFYMGNPILEFKIGEKGKRNNDCWTKLKNQIQQEYRNYVYASAEIGSYERDNKKGKEHKMFFPNNGILTDKSKLSINLAITMLKNSLEKKDTESARETLSAINTVIDYLKI